MLRMRISLVVIGIGIVFDADASSDGVVVGGGVAVDRIEYVYARFYPYFAIEMHIDEYDKQDNI